MKKSFKLIKLVAIVSQKFLPEGGYPGLMEVCLFLIGRRNEATIDIPPILNATKVEILKQHPWIGDIKVPKFKSQEQLEKWYSKFLTQRNEMVEFNKPSTEMSNEEIFTKSLECASQVTGIPVSAIKKSTKKMKEALERFS